MKKVFAIFALFLSTQLVMAAAGSDTDTKNKKGETEMTEAQKERLAEIEARVDEIKAMDFSTMSREEKKDVRMELKDMKEEAKRAGGGVYISVGAIIIILLILILVT
ncbi:Flp pilus assembly protein TadB [Algoriphagus sp. 4150]|uniref:hypothetical protein n=1 Tax=Algoriphagus sp. 4150 TaxID=2817756 RepID=UPI0028542016|nr:hypothetical protein [Algoriphagus sp. 4150]MDR7128635.1 Flp pilus assembly protein TadB [Algoriphagus sp. 4150]